MSESIFLNTQGLYQRRRAFNMSYTNDFTCNLGELVPVYWQDLIPNTSWHCRVHGLVRFLPLIAPIMSNIDMYVHFWISPDRTLYGEDFTKMITGELEAEDFVCPYFTPKSVNAEIFDLLQDDENVDDEVEYLTCEGSLLDMLGYDYTMFILENEGKLNARKFIMYIRLCHDWYANENVEPWKDFLKNFEWEELIATADCSLIIASFIVGCYKAFGTAGFLAHQWPKDYFTSALPTLQYGLPTYLPIGDSAPVSGSISATGITDPVFYTGIQGLPVSGAYDNDIKAMPNGEETYTQNYKMRIKTKDSETGSNNDTVTAINGDINAQFTGTADLSEATAITINELRIANALQVFKEREMRYGRKPQEYYRGFYGVTPGDLRLQMPKFLGGGKIPVNISDIEQTSQTTELSPQGRLAGKGTALAAGFARATAFAPEESFVLGVAWLMPHAVYSQTLSRHDTKLNDRFDYYNPSFAHIGEQPVYDYEIYGDALSNSPKEFGYQPRYTEYRFHANEMHGEFKSSLSYWTLGRIFDSAPALNAAFIYMQPEALNRVFAVQKTSSGFIFRNVLASLYFQCAVIQPLSRYGTPGLLP